MATRAHRKIRVDEFLEFKFNSDSKYELVDGAIYGMGGGSAAHARVQGNVLAYLHRHLRGTGCRAYGPDMALQTMAHTLRYPDVTIYCGDPGRNEAAGSKLLPNPRVVIEVLSPSTRSFDEGRKSEEYQSLPTVETVALIDPEEEWVRVFQRFENGQWDLVPSPETGDIPLPCLDITIPKDEIFARD